ncbi:hypothetical protein FEM48_Zijuj03G0171300 [Ziziphus jujuba var. spinosa]|uniref:Cyclic nucleotide-binding domain-containing protein n=1 Tax=Ziziphus jujuba var. spinosa TaxID=714518 RepID=A0A978VRK2_ZIZJJ|nr:hypothetical protein FEM48_Zijuj03G0171300 [Ziziphus jujuba var. spinosa]
MIDQSNKCLGMDNKLKILAIIFRLLMDLTYVTDIIYFVVKASQALKRDDPSFVGKKGEFLKNTFGIARRLSWFYVLVDFLAVLPVPQVAMLVLMWKDKWLSFDSKRFMNAIILAQYVPRVLRIYLSSLEFTKSSDKLAGTLWVKGAFNLFIYVLASHVLGGFWYFFSIQRQTSCWKQTCRKNETYAGCRIYKCPDKHDNSSDYKALLDGSCPINEPNATAFDFGIFLDALESRIVEPTTNFQEKLFYSFCSLGENLETSKYVWENCFAIAISIIGLLLFLYLIGNIQLYMQLATTRSEEVRRKMKSKMLDIDMWIEKNNLPKHLRPVIVEKVQHKLEKENRDIDVQNLFSLLPPVHRVNIKRHLCIKILRKVQVFQNMKESVLEEICSHLKPVIYGENSYIIRDGDPMHQMFFITQGTILAFTSSRSTSSSGSNSNSKSIFSTSSGSMRRLKKGDYHGEELLEWSLTHLSFTEFPISTVNVMCHTKVEGFVLKANDLLNAVKSQVERWQLLAVSVIQALWRRKHAGKSIKSKHVNIGNLQGSSNKNHRLRPINRH